MIRFPTCCVLAWALLLGSAWSASAAFPGAHGISPEFSPPLRSAGTPPVPGDQFWWDGFGSPITDGYVWCAIEFNGSLVIAGQFSRIGDVAANNIAQWSGTEWAPLGSGIESGGVNALAIDHGDLVAAGYFWFAGGKDTKSIARWNGSDWSPIGVGFQDEMARPATVLALGAYHDSLIAAVEIPRGDYRLPPRFEVTRWNGSAWVALGSGLGARINCLETAGDQLFVGGDFDSIGSVPARAVARWDGSTWSSMGQGVNSSWGSPGVYALRFHAGRLFVGGSFDSAGGIPVQHVAIWDGSTWSSAGSGLPSGVSTFTTQRDTLLAGCGNAIGRWNGQTWDFPAPRLDGTPSSLVPLGDDLIAVGSVAVFNSDDDFPVGLSIVRLSAGRWHAFNPLTERMHGLVGYGGEGAGIFSMVTYRGRVVAAGSFRYAGAPPNWIEARDLAEWDGMRWTQFPLPPGVNQIVHLLAHGDTLYASGSFYPQPSGDSSYSYIPVYRFDGTQWTALGAGPPSYVFAMALYQGDLYVAEASPGTSAPETHIRRWTGSDWALIGTAHGSTYPLVNALAQHQSKLIAAGRFLTVDGVPAADIAEWDGVSWKQLGPGLPTPPGYYSQAPVRDLAVVNGNLLVAGEAVSVNVGSSVARWTGYNWEPFGELIGQVRRLGNVAGELFASGSLHDPSNFSSSHSLARWNGRMWEQVGSATNGGVATFAALASAVYMGGSFSEVGGKASYAIARWDGHRVSAPVPTVQAPRPNPFRSSMSLPYTIPTVGMVRISVYDVRGREIVVLQEGVHAAGTYTATWNGLDHSGHRSPSGVYFIRAAMPGGIEPSRKIVLLR